MPVVWNVENAAHLLRRTGFGPRPEEITRAVERGMDATVTEILAARGKADKRSVHPSRTSLEELQLSWLARMAKTKAPLEEKLTLFWHNHFATAISKVEDAQFMNLQVQTLRNRAFGSFREMLRAIARDPAMIVWLDNQTNVADDPNENFARELMEIFTTGVYDAAGNPNYTETDVMEAARAFTGWTIRDGAFFFADFDHDFGPKTFRGVSGNLDGDDVIENLVLDPATRRRLAWKLYSFFAHDLPLDDPLLDPLIAAFQANDTAVQPMLDVLFRSDAFYSPAAKYARVKSPVEFLVGSVRLLGGKMRGGEDGEELGEMLALLGQSIYDPPTVFGWDEGLDWVSSNGLLQRAAVGERIADARKEDDPPVHWKPEKLVGKKSLWPTVVPSVLVAQFLANLGPVSPGPGTAAALEAYLQADEGGSPAPFFLDETTIDRKVRGLVALILASPEYQLC